MLHWHRIFCMLSHKTREAYLWQFLRIIMPLSFMAILTFEILNSLAWYAIQCLWTKLMWRVILKSHNEWHSYGPDKLIYGHFWPLNSKCDLDLSPLKMCSSMRYTCMQNIRLLSSILQKFGPTSKFSGRLESIYKILSPQICLTGLKLFKYVDDNGQNKLETFQTCQHRRAVSLIGL